MKADDLILRDIPQSIETPRLLMRLPQYGDGRIVSTNLNASLQEVAPYLDWLGDGQSARDTELYLRRMMANFILRTDYIFLLFTKQDEQFVGSCGAHLRKIDLPEYEIGYWQATTMTGKGYMTEAVNALTDYAFEHLSAERMMIRCDARNTASANVALRNGYVEEGMFRQSERARNDTLRDMRYFSKVRSEWR